MQGYMGIYILIKAKVGSFGTKRNLNGIKIRDITFLYFSEIGLLRFILFCPKSVYTEIRLKKPYPVYMQIHV